MNEFLPFHHHPPVFHLLSRISFPRRRLLVLVFSSLFVPLFLALASAGLGRWTRGTLGRRRRHEMGENFRLLEQKLKPLATIRLQGGIVVRFLRVGRRRVRGGLVLQTKHKTHVNKVRISWPGHRRAPLPLPPTNPAHKPKRSVLLPLSNKKNEKKRPISQSAIFREANFPTKLTEFSFVSAVSMGSSSLDIVYAHFKPQSAGIIREKQRFLRQSQILHKHSVRGSEKERGRMLFLALLVSSRWLRWKRIALSPSRAVDSLRASAELFRQ